jgi:hypothetical protein
MFIFSIAQSLGQTLALGVTFIGIGIIVTVLMVYVVAQVFAEHRQNQKEPPAS